MRFHILTALTLLQSFTAALTGRGGSSSSSSSNTTPEPTDADAEDGSRCFTSEQAEAFQRAWPTILGIGPELNMCSDKRSVSASKRTPLSASEFEAIVAKGCYTEKEIEDVEASWPADAGLGPVLIPCDNSARALLTLRRRLLERRA